MNAFIGLVKEGYVDIKILVQHMVNIHIIAHGCGNVLQTS